MRNVSLPMRRIRDDTPTRGVNSWTSVTGVFTEIADRVWLARYEWCDASVTLIGGDRGLAVVDTHASTAAGRRIVDDVRRLGAGEVVAVVNTHWHFDHTFGNAAFVEAYGPVPVHAHEACAEHLRDWGPQVIAHSAGETGERAAEVAATELHLPDQTFSSIGLLDLGDRALELIHPGRGHTAGDLVVRVPDADVLLAGDLVEESSPPYFNTDAWPLEWPLTLDVVLGLITRETLVVPGHGAVVDRDFVEDQRNTIGIVAETIRDLAARGVPETEALAAAEWPWPAEHLATAVRLGYEHLPRSQKRLPLI